MSAGKFLGFLVHHKGISVDPAKATAIATMRRPTTVRELKSFLGRISYIRRFVPGLDPGLVVHSLNVDPGMRPVVQPARVFHTKVEAQIVQEVKKLLTAGFIKPIQHPKWLSNIVPVKKKMVKSVAV